MYFYEEAIEKQLQWSRTIFFLDGDQELENKKIAYVKVRRLLKAIHFWIESELNIATGNHKLMGEGHNHTKQKWLILLGENRWHKSNEKAPWRIKIVKMNFLKIQANGPPIWYCPIEKYQCPVGGAFTW